jgi:diguanylate cyclase
MVVSSKFEKKVFTIADEVFKILKELSIENKTEIKSDQIAERMFSKDSLKGLLDDIHAITEDDGLESNRIKELSSLLLDKFSELIPSYLAIKLGNLKDDIHNKTLDSDSKEWIDSPLEVVKNYIDSISIRNNELENFLNKTAEHVSSTEEHMSRELPLLQQRFNDDIIFENHIASTIDEIKQDLSSPGDLSFIKSTVLKKIDEIYNQLEQKRKQDMQHIKNTEKTLEKMYTQLSEISLEANEMRRKSKRIEYDASHDSLTGAYNQKAYKKKMNEIHADVSRYGMTVSLMVCDIDFLKNINEKCGHKIGDLALKKLAVLIKEWVRINDFIARYSGDEFVIILPHTGHDGARVAGERLRSFIDNANFAYKGEAIPLTISIGISCFRKDDDINAVFERANNALCLAKQSGRNTVMTEEDTG